VCLPTRIELSSSGTVLGMMVGLPPIAPLCSPFEESSSAMVDHIQAGVGLSPIIGPSPEKVASSGLSMVAPGRHEVEFDLGEDSFTGPILRTLARHCSRWMTRPSGPRERLPPRAARGSRQPWPRWAM
jgi:hypothetical protein